jgi:glycosyltransferase involved in cell wall biosynthesis
MPGLKIAYLTAKDPLDRHSWSGTIFTMHSALKEYAGEVEIVGRPRPLWIRLLWHWINFFRQMFGQKLGIMQSIPLSLAYGSFFAKKLRGQGYDAVFAPIAAAEIAFLDTDVPIFYLSDATFMALENYYYDASEISRLGRWQGNFLERRAIHRAAGLLYSNEWATRSAIRDYGADSSKVHVIPFGANVSAALPLEQLSPGSRDGRCRLLFVSRDWKRKGGSIAFDALVALCEAGVDAELTVVGCVPSPAVEHPRLTVIPFLDKNVDAERQRMEDLYREADFFLLPTRAECSAIVFCEASAYGVPTISTDTGGVSTVVVEGENGYLLGMDATGAEYAALIGRLWADPAGLRQLRRSSRERYDCVLNWKMWAESVRDVMVATLAKKQERSAAEAASRQ